MGWLHTLARAAVIVVVLVAALAGLEAWRALRPTAAMATEFRMVEIPPQEGVLAIAGRLRDAQVISSVEAFVALGVARGTIRSLRAGEYDFPPGTTTLGALRMLESGKIRLHPVLQPDG